MGQFFEKIRYICGDAYKKWGIDSANIVNNATNMQRFVSFRNRIT